MKLSAGLPGPPAELSTKMHGSVSIWALPQMTSQLWVLILSCSCLFSTQPALSQLEFSTQPEDVVGLLGYPVVLHCAVYDYRQQRALSVRWERVSGQPPAGLQAVAVDILQLANGSLLFPRLRERHLGKYVCSAGDGADRISAVVQVEKAGLGPVFFSPQAQTVSEGEAVFLQCVSGDSVPPAHITWLKNGALVTADRQIQGQYGGGDQKKTSGTLHLINVTLEDEGVYVCVTHNSLLNVSRESTPTALTVLGVPRGLKITQGPNNITVVMGTEAFMRCAVPGFPVPMVHWFKDGCLLTNCSASFSFQDNGQLLVFRNVSEEDEGSYHCEASNHREAVRSQPALLLTAAMGWSFVRQPASQTARRGENATLVCRPPYSRPAAHMSWFRNNQLLTPKAHFTVMPSGDLYFHSVKESDSGTYFCRASNDQLHRSVTSRRVTLTVLAPPAVKLWPQVMTVPVGTQVALECQVWGHPPPSIRWFRKGRSIEPGDRITVGVRNATLYILSVRSMDEGTYACEASNAVGRDRSTGILRVAVSPVIVAFAGQVSSRVGDSVVLPCRAVGVLPMTYAWSSSRADTHTSITPNDSRRTDDGGGLRISSVQRTDAGEYYCTAENRAGRQQRRVILTVADEDHPADSGKQARQILSAGTDVDAGRSGPWSGDSVAERRSETIRGPQAQMQRSETTHPTWHEQPTRRRPVSPLTPLRVTMFGLKGPLGSVDLHSQRLLDQPTTHPTRPIVTQMQPPLLQPSPLTYLSRQSTDPRSRAPVTSGPFLLSYTEPPTTHSQSPLVHNRLLVTSMWYLLSQSQSRLTKLSPGARLQHQASEPLTVPVKHDAQVPDVRYYHTALEPRTVSLSRQGPVPRTQMTNLSLTGRSGSPTQASDSFTQTQNPVTLSSAAQTEMQLLQTLSQQPSDQSPFTQSPLQPSPTRHSQGKPQLSKGQLLYPKNHSQPSPTLSPQSQTAPDQPFTQSPLPQSQSKPFPTKQYPPSIEPQPSTQHGQPSQTQTQPSQIQGQPLPTQFQQPFTISPLPQTKSSPTQHHPFRTQPPLPQTEPQTPEIQPGNSLDLQPSVSTTHPPDLSSDLSTSYPEVPGAHQVTTSDQIHPNVRQQAHPAQPAQSANDTEPTEWLKRNTSQSPMTSDDPRVTQQSPSWLPVLEKHDIPIVVGVGVSLAFIFITMAFYSLVQKNEPAPTCRAAQRNLGVPQRHAERRATGRTYDNRAFEDDECVAVIEQSPNTSDTRARPPAPGLLMVQMEPTSDDLQDDPHPTLEGQSVTVETYPEPVLDTQVDPSLEVEKTCSLSQPIIQLQCVEDWPSSGGDNQDACQDALPPPSSLPSRSPSPSPPPLREEGLRSSLTLQTAEPCAGPVHHSLSISHGNSPLLLSHHVSLGPTTVAVDVHFYPAATAAVAIATSTRINSVSNTSSVTGPLFSSSLASSQENDQSASRMRQNK